VNFNENPTGIVAVLRAFDGQISAIRAKYIVGCDGAGPAVRHQLTLPFVGSTYPRLFYVADLEMDFQGSLATLHFSFRDGSVLLMLPMAGKGPWRLIGNLPEFDIKADEEVKYAEIELKIKFVLQRPIKITTVHWFSRYKVHTPPRRTILIGQSLSCWGCCTHSYSGRGPGNEYRYSGRL